MDRRYIEEQIRKNCGLVSAGDVAIKDNDNDDDDNDNDDNDSDNNDGNDDNDNIDTHPGFIKVGGGPSAFLRLVPRVPGGDLGIDGIPFRSGGRNRQKRPAEETGGRRR